MHIVYAYYIVFVIESTDDTPTGFEFETYHIQGIVTTLLHV